MRVLFPHRLSLTGSHDSASTMSYSGPDQQTRRRRRWLCASCFLLLYEWSIDTESWSWWTINNQGCRLARCLVSTLGQIDSWARLGPKHRIGKPCKVSQVIHSPSSAIQAHQSGDFSNQRAHLTCSISRQHC